MIGTQTPALMQPSKTTVKTNSQSLSEAVSMRSNGEVEGPRRSARRRRGRTISQRPRRQTRSASRTPPTIVRCRHSASQERVHGISLDYSQFFVGIKQQPKLHYKLEPPPSRSGFVESYDARPSLRRVFGRCHRSLLCADVGGGVSVPFRVVVLHAGNRLSKWHSDGK